MKLLSKLFFCVCFVFLSNSLTFASLDRDLEKLLTQNPIVEYKGDYYVRVYSEKRFDGTSYTELKVGDVLMDRFCSKEENSSESYVMKTKINGLIAIDYFPTYKGTYTTFMFPEQKVECVSIAPRKKTMAKFEPETPASHSKPKKNPLVKIDTSEKVVTRKKNIIHSPYVDRKVEKEKY